MGGCGKTAVWLQRSLAGVTREAGRGVIKGVWWQLLIVVGGFAATLHLARRQAGGVATRGVAEVVRAFAASWHIQIMPCLWLLNISRRARLV